MGISRQISAGLVGWLMAVALPRNYQSTSWVMTMIHEQLHPRTEAGCQKPLASFLWDSDGWTGRLGAELSSPGWGFANLKPVSSSGLSIRGDTWWKMYKIQNVDCGGRRCPPSQTQSLVTHQCLSFSFSMYTD